MASKILAILVLLSNTFALSIPSFQPPMISDGALNVLHFPSSYSSTTVASSITNNSSASNLTVWPGVSTRVYIDNSVKSEYIDILQYSEKYWEAAFNRAYFRNIQAALAHIWNGVPIKQEFDRYRARSGPVTFELEVLPKDQQGTRVCGWDIRRLVYCILFVEQSFRSPAEVWAVYTKEYEVMARLRVLFADNTII